MACVLEPHPDMTYKILVCSVYSMTLLWVVYWLLPQSRLYNLDNEIEHYAACLYMHP